MKTTVTIPDDYHLRLKKLAIDESKTMADLICEALINQYFQDDKKHENRSPLQKSHPLTQIQGILEDFQSVPSEMQSLKKLWRS